MNFRIQFNKVDTLCRYLVSKTIIIEYLMKEEGKDLFMVYDYHLAGLLIFSISIVGVFSNIIVAFYTSRLPTMRNAFGRLTASQATAEAILSCVFAFYVSPVIMFDVSSYAKISAQTGWVNLICYDVCCMSHMFIALNRMSAICTPLSYDFYFNLRNTRILIVISWILPVITAVVLYKLHDCDLYFSEKFWAFVFTQNDICNFISWNIDFYKDISIVTFIAIVDIITIYNVRNTQFQEHHNSSQAAVRKRKNEVNFLKQACLQGVVFVIELLTYFYFAWKFESKYIIFLLTTAAWTTVHTTDAIIIISFNKEFRSLVTKPFRMEANEEEFPGIGTDMVGTGVCKLSSLLHSHNKVAVLVTPTQREA